MSASYPGRVALSCRRTILIAEDDRAVRRSLERTLRLEEYEVTAVRTGVEAVESCSETLSDLLILDVTMPDMDGLTACRTLRPLHPELPILMLKTANDVAYIACGIARPTKSVAAATAERTGRVALRLKPTAAAPQTAVGSMPWADSSRVGWTAERSRARTPSYMV